MIDSATLKQERDGKPFYYHVKFTVFGELLELEDDVSDLPDIAQKLILGNQKEKTITGLKRGLGNLKYIIPLIALGEVYKLPKWLKPIEIVLQKLQKNLPREIKRNPNDYISSEWVKELMAIKRHNFSDAGTSMQFVNYLLEEDLLLNIPSIPDQEIHIATQPLLETLENNWTDRKLASTILNVLQKSKHPAALKKFIAIFTHQNQLIDFRVLAGRGLANMDFDQVKETLFYALTDKNHWIRIEAIKSLRPFVQEEEVVNKLINILREDQHQWVRVRAIESLGFTKNNKKVIRLLATIIKAKNNEEICFHAVQSLKRINSKEAEFVLRQYWY